MNGSYSVPMGSSRSPLIECDRPERRQQDEQIHLGDAELDVLALRRELPVERRGDALALEGVGHALAGEQAAAVDPGAEIGRDGDVRRGGDDALGERRLLARQLVEQRAEAELRRHLRLDRHRELIGRRILRRLQPALRRRTRTAPCRGTPSPARALRAGPRTDPIRGLCECPSPGGTSPSATASSARRGCPCGRRSAGRSPSPCRR